MLLVACSSSETEPSLEDSEQFDPNSFEIPLSSTLAIGTLELEETDHLVTSDQAADLLPLWQVLNSLSSSDNAAQEEIEAILEQIQETMTTEQLKAIDGMELSREDIFTTMQDFGVEFGFGSGEGRPEGFSGGGPGGGGFPGGGPPGGGPGGGLGGQEISPEQMATAQARRTEGGGIEKRMLTPLAEAVIELLESKVQ